MALPGGLEMLYFGHSFSQALEKVALPSTLKTLSFGDSWDQPLDQVPLPPLHSMTLGESFNRSPGGIRND